jgi:hypothetical protein
MGKTVVVQFAVAAVSDRRRRSEIDATRDPNRTTTGKTANSESDVAAVADRLWQRDGGIVR